MVGCRVCAPPGQRASPHRQVYGRTRAEASQRLTVLVRRHDSASVNGSISPARHLRNPRPAQWDFELHRLG